VETVRHKTAAHFLERAGAWLERAEAENNLFLGVAAFFKTHSETIKLDPYFLSVEDEGTIVGIAVLTPPRRLLMTCMPDLAVTALVDYLLDEAAPVPGVLGPRTTAKRFADEWAAKTGKLSRPKMSQRIYICKQLIAPTFSPGRLRLATAEDESLVTEWCVAFCRDAGIEDEIAPTKARIPSDIAKQALYFWDNNQAVSMAVAQRETARGICVSMVYTPRHLRNQGYATSCVAALTQRMLESGKRFCSLYTDLANPTSNSIYQKIGYQPICEVQDWVFEQPEQPSRRD
jgi:predicted GNAT family acetyltransferase